MVRVQQRGVQRGARRRARDPYAVFPAVERLFGLDQASSFRDRALAIWRCTVAFWEEDRDVLAIRRQLRLVRRALQLCIDQIFHKNYLVSSNARWLCALKTYLRVAAGVLVAAS